MGILLADYANPHASASSATPENTKSEPSEEDIRKLIAALLEKELMDEDGQVLRWKEVSEKYSPEDLQVIEECAENYFGIEFRPLVVLDALGIVLGVSSGELYTLEYDWIRKMHIGPICSNAIKILSDWDKLEKCDSEWYEEDDSLWPWDWDNGYMSGYMSEET